MAKIGKKHWNSEGFGEFRKFEPVVTVCTGWVFSRITRLGQSDNDNNGKAGLYKFSLRIETGQTIQDTNVYPKNFAKGQIFVNGKNLGRYWTNEGPQMSLFLPAPWLIEGDNEIILFEEEECATESTLQFTSEFIIKGENEPNFETSALKQDGIWFTLNGEKIQNSCFFKNFLE